MPIAPCQQCWSFWCSLFVFLWSESLEPSWNLIFLLPVNKPRSRYFGSLRVLPRPSMVNIFVACHAQAPCQQCWSFWCRLVIVFLCSKSLEPLLKFAFFVQCLSRSQEAVTLAVSECPPGPQWWIFLLLIIPKHPANTTGHLYLQKCPWWVRLLTVMKASNLNFFLFNFFQFQF